ncbi:hypothetical protein DX130_10005 [Paenibacillus paeoniae]|uniref:Uncharacterized protein n=1 Tax=Paenibacillus paeoniae TaxID=2292705 RepID=A0A371PM78_9BACL|nr:hypothetical protein DX130_10005 [Paenibacillus paeoniae]
MIERLALWRRLFLHGRTLGEWYSQAALSRHTIMKLQGRSLLSLSLRDSVEIYYQGIISSNSVNTGKDNSTELHIYLSGGTFR